MHWRISSSVCIFCPPVLFAGISKATIGKLFQLAAHRTTSCRFSLSSTLVDYALSKKGFSRFLLPSHMLSGLCAVTCALGAVTVMLLMFWLAPLPFRFAFCHRLVHNNRCGFWCLCAAVFCSHCVMCARCCWQNE